MNYCNPEGFRNEVKELLAKGDVDAFYNWFNGGETKEGAFKKGEDVYDRIIYPLVEKYIKEKDPVALDLGYGGGTKIQAALSGFSMIFGVDVHEEFDFIFENLNLPKGREVRLLAGDGCIIPVGSGIIDCVYSWATFCHVGTIDNVKKYLEEIYRVLKPGGVAVLFFTRLIVSKRGQSWKEVEMDMKREEEHIDGYREGGPLSKVRSINLVMSMWKMVELVEMFGFVTKARTAAWHDGPFARIYQGQYGIVIEKPKPKPVETRGNKPGVGGKPKMGKKTIRRRKNG